METIHANVNRRLLTKADRLFTGTLQGRIIEILQNGRRAGASRVEIVNRNNTVVVRDNGSGIEHFARLLDLGGSGWEQALEASEDPAGVGLFCLAPRRVTIRSNGRTATIEGDGWTGAPVSVRTEKQKVPGTELLFDDEPWTLDAVQPHAVFSGLEVIVDGATCAREPFLSDHAVHCPELGCRIEVRDSCKLNEWQRVCARAFRFGDNALVNFHGQVVAFDFHPISERGLWYLVELTGEPTGIRLMLPARTRLVENEAFTQLKAALELEAFRYLERRGHHRLPYAEYLRARDLGVALPEAEVTYRAGLLFGDNPEPVEINKPEEFPLSRCYRFDEADAKQETDAANIHLLAALGTFEERFVPVEIDKHYLGYHWADLPTVTAVELRSGKVLQQGALWYGFMVCVDTLEVTVSSSDGRTWSSPVCMALQPPEGGVAPWFHEVWITPDARTRLTSTELLYHLGGYSEDGDTWGTQEREFEEELERFWDRMAGPDETLRRRVFEVLRSLDGWRSITLNPDGRMVLTLQDGSKRILTPTAR